MSRRRDSGVAAKSIAVKEADQTIEPFIRLGPPEQVVGPIVTMSLSVDSSGETIVFQDNRGWAVKSLERRLPNHSPANEARMRAPARSAPTTATLRSRIGKRVERRFGTANRERISPTWPWDGTGVVQFSPDGRLLAATPDGVTLWRTEDWQRVGQLHAKGRTPDGLGIAFSPDSRVLAVGQVNGILGLFDPLTGKEWAHLSSRDLSVVSTMAFSPDQRWLVVSSLDEHSPAQVWDLMAMRRELAARGLDLPTDVLRATVNPQSFQEHIDVVLDGGELFESSRSPDIESSSSTSNGNSR